MLVGAFFVNAWIARKEVTVDAWVIGDRHRHHRAHDHVGADSDLYVTIDEPLGKWAAGTPIKFVIAELFDRVNRLTSYSHQIRVARLDAVVLAPGDAIETTPGTFLTMAWLDSMVWKSMASSFVMESRVDGGGSLTLDAWTRGGDVLYVDAFIV